MGPPRRVEYTKALTKAAPSSNSTLRQGSRRSFIRLTRLTPKAALLNRGPISSTLYGTTQAGGPGGDGTVFKVNPTNATFSVVHTFAGGTDGFAPQAGVIDVGGYLYGTTMFGGSSGNGNGTVFKVSPSTGENIVIHKFISNGAQPMAALLDVGGVLYGTTFGGGAYQNGTIFKMAPAGKDYGVAHSFGGPVSPSDGASPEAALINVGGVLFGTNCNGGQGGGVVFSFTP
jgi:uncharacterized repeat protein (TIGR03803 family)